MTQDNDNKMLRLQNMRRPGIPDPNVARNERLFSIITGLVFFTIGATRRTLASTMLLLVGAYMLFRGVSGRCFGYQMLGMSTLERQQLEPPYDEPPPPSVEESDEVIESSWESFPTSDPPSFTMGKRGQAEET